MHHDQNRGSILCSGGPTGRRLTWSSAPTQEGGKQVEMEGENPFTQPGVAHHFWVAGSGLHCNISAMDYHLFLTAESYPGSYLNDVQKSRFNLL